MILMKEPYIFGHRGFMGRYIENTIDGFKKAVSLGAGIESDIQLTKDKKLVCFHDASFKIAGKWYDLSKLSFKEVKLLKFKDKRAIPSVSEVFKTFKISNQNLRYSFDIRNKDVGVSLIDVIKNYKLLEKVEITERKIKTLTYLRKYNADVKLIYTLPERIKDIHNIETELNLLKNLNITTINLVSWRATIKNINTIIDNNFKCYVWGVNRKVRMKKFINYIYTNKHICAIYTDFPDTALKLKERELSMKNKLLIENPE